VIWVVARVILTYQTDSSVRERTAQDSITPAAYLLFYRRRSDHPLGGPLLEQIKADQERGDTDMSGQEDEEGGSRATSPSGEGRRLGGSSRNGSSKAFGGVGHTLATGAGTNHSLRTGGVGSLPAKAALALKGAEGSTEMIPLTGVSDDDNPPIYSSDLIEGETRVRDFVDNGDDAQELELEDNEEPVWQLENYSGGYSSYNFPGAASTFQWPVSKGGSEHMQNPSGSDGDIEDEGPFADNDSVKVNDSSIANSQYNNLEDRLRDFDDDEGFMGDYDTTAQEVERERAERAEAEADIPKERGYGLSGSPVDEAFEPRGLADASRHIASSVVPVEISPHVMGTVEGEDDDGEVAEVHVEAGEGLIKTD
jgi:hypothetical protein